MITSIEGLVVLQDNSDYSFEELNIYSKDRFEIASLTRRMRFRFIRYLGDNYQGLVEYLQELVPSLVVPEEHLLIKGSLYGYSGRTGCFCMVNENQIRSVIASLPYLVDKGSLVPLSMSCLRISRYLKESPGNCAFCYEDILSTYSYDSIHEQFCVFNRNHSNGMVINGLPNSGDWYIGTEDYLAIDNRRYKVNYEPLMHLVNFVVDYDGFVMQLDRIKYEINRTSLKLGGSLLFEPQWDDFSRRTILLNPVFSKTTLVSFLKAIASYIAPARRSKCDYDQIRVNKGIEKDIKCLLGYYSSEESQKDRCDERAYQVFDRYLDKNSGPFSEEEYQSVKYGVISDVVDYLEDVLVAVSAKKSKFSGIIEEDENGNIHCGGVLLPRRYMSYVGCIGNGVSVNNLDKNTQSVFDQYCKYVEEVLVDYYGQIETDGKIYYCGDYYIPQIKGLKVGDRIHVMSIIPPNPVAKSRFKGKIKKFQLCEG